MGASVTICLATADGSAVERLADLDSRAAPRGDVRLGDRAGRRLGALVTYDRRIAEPAAAAGLVVSAPG